MFDLSHDPAPYLDASEKDMGSLLRTSPRPIRIVKANQSPILAPHNLSHGGVAGHDGQTLVEMREKVRAVREHPTFAANVASAVANRYPPRDASEYVEKQIYEGFPKKPDERRMERFHGQPWEERMETVSQFENGRLRELGERLIYIERPDVLPDDTRQRYDAWRHDRFHAEGKVPWVTVASAHEELSELRSTTDEHADLLSEIRGFLAQNT